MKRNLLLFFLSTFASSAMIGQTSDLIISEYVEGSSNNKYIEIYNGTGSTVDLDAGGYKILMYFNGASSAGYTLTLNGSINDGAVFVIAHSSATIYGGTIHQTGGGGWFNGDDAVALVKGGSNTLVDLIGNIGCDPGSQWGSGLLSTEDNTIRRQSSYGAGVISDPSNSPCEFPTLNSTNWIGASQNDVSGLGSFSLPISLLSFDATPQSTSTLLTFSTATELDNDYFSIERSADGSRFEEIGRVAGADNSTSVQEYTFTDERPFKGTNYYRLKQVDYDGQFSYSPVRSVVFGGTSAQLRISPVPASEEITVRFEESTDEAISWEVYDQTGRLVLQGQEDAEIELFRFNVTTLTEGFYILKVNKGREVMTERFQKK